MKTRTIEVLIGGQTRTITVEERDARTEPSNFLREARAYADMSHADIQDLAARRCPHGMPALSPIGSRFD